MPSGRAIAPLGTPGEFIVKLNTELNSALADPEIKTRIADLGGVPMPTSPTDFARLVTSETAKWGKVIKFAGIKTE